MHRELVGKDGPFDVFIESERHAESKAYLEFVAELPDLHEEKSSTYGTLDSPFKNFYDVGAANRRDVLLYILDRITEKCTRARNMIESGQWDKNTEFQDLAGLAACGEAITRVRRNRKYKLEDRM